jgi:hypothetical protein
MLGSLTRAPFAAFNLPVISFAGWAAAGAVANAYLSGQVIPLVGRYLPIPFMPVLIGGMFESVSSLVKVAASKVGIKLGQYDDEDEDEGLDGFGDYLTTQNVADARSLGSYGDYLTTQNVADARSLGGYGDYLSPQNAANARALGSLGDEAISEELASL